MDKGSASSDEDSSTSSNVDRCNVFVKYLPPEVTDTGLYAMFSPFGEIVSCKVMVDTQTGNSLGYGFCRFSNPDDAQECISKMSGTKYRNKTLLCRLSSYNVQTEPSDNLYVKSLLPTTTENDLRELFGQVGSIKDCKIIVDKKTKKSQQIGFVRFHTIEDAHKALERFNGHHLDETHENPLVVRFAETKSQKIARRAKVSANQSAAAVRNAEAYYSQLVQQAQSDFTSMYGYRSPTIPYVLTDTYGNVTYAPTVIPPNGAFQQASSPNFQPFVGQEYAYNYNDQLVPLEPDHGDSGFSNNLFIFHLPSSVTDQALYQLFVPFGPLRSVKVMRHPETGASRGFGFVQYFHINSAYQAITHMNGCQLENKFLKVTFKSKSQNEDNKEP